MIVRLLLVIAVTSVFSAANAQNCYNSSVAFSDPCTDAVNSFKTARANCKSGNPVTAGGSTGACQSPSALVSNIAAQCSSQCTVPIQTVWYAQFTSAVASYEESSASLNSSNLVKVTWKHTTSGNYCTPRTYTYVAVLDKVKDAAFFAAYPSADPAKYVTVKLACSSSTVSTTTYDSNNNPTITYSSNCSLSSFSASSAPVVYCQIP